ncbi:hypothetical protein PR202_ga16135 [Eleusine coracana subsp. coracana]|uniref:F-box domain-containing protein n=1 Tax=Eleusine coracana subsp. coracana TaxID=191504 RepID=A0AAV5CLY6_ELECO|nr:hypothetical protein PR202_ga16135 [Eleusine coracana subsp. coracana]
MEDYRKNAGSGTAAVHRLPSDLLESIFLRLPSLLHLVRAACVCKRWRRVAADDGFLRDFSLDFLPDRGWEIADRRGFIYLLLNQDTSSFLFPDLVIWEIAAASAPFCLTTARRKMGTL